MQTLINALREIVGYPNFYHTIAGSEEKMWDYGSMFEYFVASAIILITVGSVFKIIKAMFD